MTSRFWGASKNGLLGGFQGGGAGAAAASTVLSTTNGVNKSSTITVSGSPALTATGASSPGVWRGVRATAQPSGSKYWFEVVINTIDSLSMSFGGEDTTGNFNSGASEPGVSTSTGFNIKVTPTGTIQYWASSGGTGVNLNATAGIIAVGDTIRVERDKGTGSVDVYRVRSGTQTKMGATQTLAALTNETAWFGMFNLGGVTFNFGQSEAATGSSVTSGFNPYG